MEALTAFFSAINGFVWGPPMLVLILGTGLLAAGSAQADADPAHPDRLPHGLEGPQARSRAPRARSAPTPR